MAADHPASRSPSWSRAMARPVTLLPIAPELSDVDGVHDRADRGRAGATRPNGQGLSLRSSAGSGSWAARSTESFKQIGRVFGPQGIGRVFTLLFTNEPRTAQDPTSVVGIGQQVGATGAAGDWGDGPLLPRVRDGLHRAAEPAAAAAVRRGTPGGARDREDPRQARSTCAR